MNFFLNLGKLLLFILLIPVVVVLSVVFYQAVWSLPNRYAVSLMWGAGSFLVMHLFIIEIQGAFEFGKKLMSDLFKFSGPLSESFGYAIPIFSLLLLLFFYITGLVFGAERPDRYFMFFAGFTFTMHVVLSASSLRGAGETGAGTGYYFHMSLVYIASVLLIALCFSLLFTEFSFLQLFKSVVADAGHIYRTVFNQLFVK